MMYLCMCCENTEMLLKWVIMLRDGTCCLVRENIWGEMTSSNYSDWCYVMGGVWMACFCMPALRSC